MASSEYEALAGGGAGQASSCACVHFLSRLFHIYILYFSNFIAFIFCIIFFIYTIFMFCIVCFSFYRDHFPTFLCSHQVHFFIYTFFFFMFIFYINFFVCKKTCLYNEILI